ncbi:sialidase family protein [Paenibacillus sp. MMS20-IR301]|uniref:sialidase family protein n=1 Tax=Paenibacillus sp. MMS20-IR301 TaxID=2895946 RepID=UPI0028E2FD10|nr:sialidase family protein [Paenibacillus sp. MMS20-IR301]WNS41779.1 sialidase family protein [Paenibacillus sp. MMS20-IR301]
MTNFNFQVTTGLLPKFEPSIAVNLLIPGIMVAVAVDFTTGVPMTGLYRSLDGGANWSNSMLPLPPGFTGAEAPVVAYGFPSTFVVTAHVFPGASDGTTVIYKSTDNGATFSPPVIVNSGYGVYINNDETNVTIDVGQSSPYLGNTYVTYNHQFNVANGGNSTAFFSRSRDGGTTWDQPIVLSSISDQVERPDVAFDLVGTVYGAWVTVNTPSRFFVRISLDGGTTFAPQRLVSEVTPVPTVLPVPGYAFRVLTFANVSTDRSSGPFSGRAYAVWQDFRQGYSDILMSFSDNTGTSWSSPVSITGAPAGSQNFFPAIDVDPLLGVVNIIYYSNQVNGFLLDVYVARSINGGQSFTNTRITNTSFDPNAGSVTPVTVIGDYIDISSVPPGGYIGIWMDTSTGAQNIVAGYSDTVIT